MKKVLSIVMLVCMMLSLAVVAQAEETLTFALLPKTLTNEYFVAMKDKAQAACDALGVELVYDAPTEETMIQEQITMFETMLVKGVDGILVVPNGTDEIVASVEAANAAGIPVITLDTNANGGEILAFIGTDNYAGGVLAGEWIAENYNGKVACITGVPGNLTHTQRTEGFLEGISGKDNIVLAQDPVPGYCERQQGYDRANDLMVAHPDLVAIYCCNDQMAMGAGEAIKAAGKEIAVVGFDGSPDVAQGIIDGTCAGSVAQAPGMMAEMGVNALYEYIVNGTAPAEQTVYTGCAIVCADNAAEYLTWH